MFSSMHPFHCIYRFQYEVFFYFLTSTQLTIFLLIFSLNNNSMYLSSFDYSFVTVLNKVQITWPVLSLLFKVLFFVCLVGCFFASNYVINFCEFLMDIRKKSILLMEDFYQSCVDPIFQFLPVLIIFFNLIEKSYYLELHNSQIYIGISHCNFMFLKFFHF